jgi:ubiquinone/menaquinone biosynthesis C-methylase UbiE
MIKMASLNFPNVNFEVADLLELHYPDHSFNAAIAFYAIVHFDYDQIKIAFEQVNRVLKNESEFLFSFHIGNEIVSLDNFLDEEVNIKFQFFEIEKIKTLLHETDYTIIDAIKRDPYASEHPTERAYIWAKKDPLTSYWQ